MPFGFPSETIDQDICVPGLRAESALFLLHAARENPVLLENSHAHRAYLILQ
jgi:hypothetical protein